MKITTKNIIKMFPLEDNLKEKLLAKFDDLPIDQKYELEQVFWGAFNSWYGLKLEENTKLALLKADKGEDKLDENFYKKVREKTDRDVQNGMIENVESADLEQAKRAMRVIVKEINASKN